MAFIGQGPNTKVHPANAWRASAALGIAIIAAAIAIVFDIPRPLDRAASESVTLRVIQAEQPGETLRVDAEIVSGTPRQVRAWFNLAPPDSEAPWLTGDFRSAVLNRRIFPGEPAVLSWSEPILLMDGVYEISIWVEEYRNGSWVPLIQVQGGDSLPTFRLETGNTRSSIPEGGGAGLLRLSKLVTTEGRFHAELAWNLFEDTKNASLVWELHLSDSEVAQPTYRGRPFAIAQQGSASISESPAIVPGAYDLWVWLKDGEGRSTRLVSRRVVTTSSKPPFVRKLESIGTGEWISTGDLDRIQSGVSNPLPLVFSDRTVECFSYWSLWRGEGVVLQGSAGPCSAPTFWIPTTHQGEFQLELGAFQPSPNGGQSVQLDAVWLDVHIVEAGSESQ